MAISRSPLRSFPLRPFFFFNDTATTEIYTLSLHDALPISVSADAIFATSPATFFALSASRSATTTCAPLRASSSATSRPTPFPPPATSTILRSEEHTSELQSHLNLVCRLLLEKKKN